MTPLTITIPAAGNSPGAFSYHGSGKYFLVTALNGPFRVISSKGDEYAFTENNTSPTFGKLTFYNDTGTPVTITFYVSNTSIKVADVSVSSAVTVQTALTNTLAGCAAAAPGEALVTVAAAGTPVAFVAQAGTTFARTIICIPQKTIAPVSKGGAANAGTVYVGVGPGGGQQSLPLLPGVPFIFQADTGAKFDLNSFSLDADNVGDGLVIIYW
jgi:hypothetical protein